MSDPEGMKVEPKESIYFNAPFNVDSQNTSIRVTNKGEKRVLWAIKSTNLERFSVDPKNGHLDPGKSVALEIICNSFDEKPDDQDRITLAWREAPTPDASFDKETFEKDDNLRHVWPVHYNT